MEERSHLFELVIEGEAPEIKSVLRLIYTTLDAFPWPPAVLFIAADDRVGRQSHLKILQCTAVIMMI